MNEEPKPTVKEVDEALEVLRCAGWDTYVEQDSESARVVASSPRVHTTISSMLTALVRG